MSALLAVTVAGWGSSAALALALARRRAAALTRGERLAGVVHELRGPLQAAVLILTAVRRDAGPQAGRALTALEVELGRLTLAVGDLGVGGGGGERAAGGTGGHRRGRAREGDGGARWARSAGPACDAAALIAELAPGWQVLAAAHGRELRVALPGRPLWVRAERLRLAQALGNLVGNALEHGAGTVEVRLGAATEGGARAEVRDAGPGLPASVTALVARPPDPARARGRGLGIAARIAADAGGRLWSAPAAHGARLVLQVPPPRADRGDMRPTGPLAS